MDDNIKTVLQIGGVGVPVIFHRKDEEIARKAAAQVTEMVNKLMQNYRVESKERLLAMTAYLFALEKLKLEQRNDTRPYEEKIEELARLLDKHLGQP